VKIPQLAEGKNREAVLAAVSVKAYVPEMAGEAGCATI
jgi:hypothetical protein